MEMELRLAGYCPKRVVARPDDAPSVVDICSVLPVRLNAPAAITICTILAPA